MDGDAAARSSHDDDRKPAANSLSERQQTPPAKSKAAPPQKAKPRKKKSKKPKDMPRRPLSSYNIFFREQRAIILNERREQNKYSPEESDLFSSMAKTIAKRWRQLGPSDAVKFQQLAEMDLKRYRGEMEEYQLNMARKHVQMTAARKSALEQGQEEGSGVLAKPPLETGVVDPVHHQPQQQGGVGFLATSDLAAPPQLQNVASPDLIQQQTQCVATGEVGARSLESTNYLGAASQDSHASPQERHLPHQLPNTSAAGCGQPQPHHQESPPSSPPISQNGSVVVRSQHTNHTSIQNLLVPVPGRNTIYSSLMLPFHGPPHQSAPQSAMGNYHSTQTSTDSSQQAGGSSIPESKPGTCDSSPSTGFSPAGVSSFVNQPQGSWVPQGPTDLSTVAQLFALQQLQLQLQQQQQVQQQEQQQHEQCQPNEQHPLDQGPEATERHHP